jgi:hypothetical protein
VLELSDESIDRYSRSSLEALVRGTPRDDVLSDLESRFGERNARLIADRAFADYENLKRQSQSLPQFEALLPREKVRLTVRTKTGLGLIVVGAVLSSVTFLGGASGGLIFFAPILYGVYLIFSKFHSPTP